MASRFLVPLFAVVAAAALCPQSKAAVHYFMVEGNFDTSTIAKEVYKWRIEDPNNVLQTGQDILNSIFGAASATPGPVSTTGAGFKLNYTYYEASEFYPESFFLTGITKLNLPGAGDDQALNANFGAGIGWNYYVAGGSQAPAGLGYADGSWTGSATGTGQRSLLEGGNPAETFDGWVFGNDGYEATPMATLTAPPSVDTFAGLSTLIQSYGNGVQVYEVNAVPEPGRSLLAILAISIVVGRRRKFAKS